ncbi:hypothetical protein SEMRO_981_G227530.1 [Seminavis robusta]|uniref:Uncharacterized protein n=1 Tax=Seminavis robusta TaxID=568900 RepID=A0A9N8HM99_9STRA|nr:hypothetical protein SEMRO_981_G227530.1 [Seminavis robusta]|eukprot:Sro981_g227530.1 n/a (196) ;mRNA; r:15771-16453
MEEGLDPLDLAKIVEARQKDSDASPTEQEHTINLHPTNKDTQTHSAVTETHGYEEEALSSHDLVKLVEARLEDSGLDQGENTTTPERENSVSAVDNIEQQNHHQNTNGIVQLPRLERSSANRMPHVQPGAYPSGGNFQGIEENYGTEETHIEPATTPTPAIEPENGNSGLAVANLVEDEMAAQGSAPGSRLQSGK